MRVVTAPEEMNIGPNGSSVFLAGGITSAPEWQDQMIDLLKNTDLLLYNPRRKEYHKHVQEQIKWEYQKLRQSSAILFWFPYPAQCIITMYELGVWATMTKVYSKPIYNSKPIFVGVDPRFWRKEDIEIQMSLLRPDLQIVDSLIELSKQVKTYFKENP